VQPQVPDELRWSSKTLDAEILAGRVLLLDVIVAIKSAMPESWLADHSMSDDFLSICFSKSRPEIVAVYAAALHAWRAADVLVPPSSDVATQSGAVGGNAERGEGSHAIPSSDASVTGHRGQLLLQLMRMFCQELQICLASHPAPPEPPAYLSIDGIQWLQSMFLSARCGESSGRNSDSWAQLCSQLPQVLSLASRECLFRKISGTSENDLQRLKKDRVNNVERSCILDWAASIAAAMRGRRNPLAIQVPRLAPSICLQYRLIGQSIFVFILWCIYSSLTNHRSSAKTASRSLGSEKLSPNHFFAMLQMPSQRVSFLFVSDMDMHFPNAQIFSTSNILQHSYFFHITPVVTALSSGYGHVADRHRGKCAASRISCAH